MGRGATATGADHVFPTSSERATNTSRASSRPESQAAYSRPSPLGSAAKLGAGARLTMMRAGATTSAAALGAENVAPSSVDVHDTIRHRSSDGAPPWPPWRAS